MATDNYNYYVGVGVKILASQKDLNAMLSKYTLSLRNVKVSFDTAYLAKQFRSALTSALNSMGTTHAFEKARGISDKTQTNIQSNLPSISEVERSLGLKPSQLEKSVSLYDELGTEIRKVNTYARDADSTLKITLDRLNNVLKTETIEKTYATQSAAAYEQTQKKLQYLGSNGKLTAKQMSYFNNELAKIAELTGKEKVNRLKQFNQELNLTGRRALSISGQLSEAFKKFMIWSTATVVVASLTKGISSVVREIKKLDDAIVELNKVADLSSSELNSVLDKANTIAGRVINTADEVVKAVAQFKKAGYSLEEAYNLAETALIMTNVADGINDVNEASSSLIAILKGFNLQASQSTQVLDILNHISNNFAVDVNNLADGMTRISAVFNQTNTSLEQTTALLTATYEVLRNAETASQGLNAISQRMRKMTEDGQDNTTVIASIEKVFQKYTRGAVSIYDSNRELRSTYDVLEDLHSVWDGLSSSAQAYITEAVAGNRQNKVLVALMSNWATVEKVIAESAKANGSALEENAKYADSVSGKLNNLKQAWNELAQATLNSDVVKFVLEALTNIVKLTTKLGGLGKVIASIGVMLLTLKLPSMVKNLHNLNTSLGFAKLNTLAQVTAQKQNTAAVQENTTALTANAAATSTAALKTAKLNKTLLIIQVVITAITVVINGVQYLNNSLTEAQKEQTEAAYENARVAKERLNTFIQERDEYIKYSSILERTTSEIRDLNKAEYKLAETYGFTASQMGKANLSLEERKKKLSELFHIQQQEVQSTQYALKEAFYTVGNQARLEAYYGQQEGRLTPSQVRRWETIAEEAGALPIDELLALKSKIKALDLYQNQDIFNLTTAITTLSNLPAMELENIKTQAPSLADIIAGEGGSQVEALKTIDKEIERIKSLLGIGTTASIEITQEFNEIISSYNELKKTIEQTDFAYNALDDKLSMLTKIQSEREEELKTEEKLKAVEEARLALAKAQSQYKRVLTEQGWQYIRDDEQVQSATEQLTKAIKDAGLDDLSQAISGIETLQDILSSMVGEEKDAMLAYYREAENLSNWLNADWQTKLQTLDALLSRATGYKGSFTSDYFKNYGKTSQIGDISPYIPSHHIGGVVGNIHINPNEQISKLLKGEVVLTEPQQRNLISAYNKKGGNLSINIGNISTKEDNVDCYNFIEQIKQISSLQIRKKRY